ncbi:MAG: LysM peptidoglycan-binding domain-containing protein [Pseudomonadota bacterium]
MSRSVMRIPGRQGMVTVSVLLATTLAGCSADSMRFDSPLFMTEGSGATGSITPVPLASVGEGGVVTPPPAAQTGTFTQPAAPLTQQPLVQQPLVQQPITQQTAGTYQPPRVDLGATAPAGGGAVVQQGDTLFSIAQRHGTTVPELMNANGLTDPTAIRVGQSLRLPSSATQTQQTGPVQLASTTPAVVPPAATPPVATQPAVTPPAVTPPTVTNPTRPLSGTHTVQQGETVFSIGRRYGVSANTIIAQNNLGDGSQLRVGQQLVIPEPGTAAQTPPAVATQPDTAVQQVTTAPVTAPEPAVADTPEQPVQQTTLGQQQLPEPEAMQGTSFRWPVRGRILSGFGESLEGGRNDGINIAVPAGTSIRAAENGVVIYAGSELQGFGNLILIRHAEGWVTAYAHNEELLVSRGDEIKRGQIIARAGSSGNVSAPQLHFEVRKGSQPVDPLQYLSAL